MSATKKRLSDLLDVGDLRPMSVEEIEFDLLSSSYFIGNLKAKMVCGRNSEDRNLTAALAQDIAKLEELNRRLMEEYQKRNFGKVDDRERPFDKLERQSVEVKGTDHVMHMGSL